MDKMSPDDDGGEGDDELCDVGEAAVHEAGQLGPGLLPEHVVSHCTVLYCTVLYCTVLYCTWQIVLLVIGSTTSSMWNKYLQWPHDQGQLRRQLHGSQDFAAPPLMNPFMVQSNNMLMGVF